MIQSHFLFLKKHLSFEHISLLLVIGSITASLAWHAQPFTGYSFFSVLASVPSSQVLKGQMGQLFSTPDPSFMPPCICIYSSALVMSFALLSEWHTPNLFFSSVQFSSVAQLCLTLCDSMTFLSSPTSGVHPNACPLIESVMPFNCLIPVVPFSSCPQYFPASGSFQMSQLFASSGQRFGVSTSASVHPMNIQD